MLTGGTQCGVGKKMSDECKWTNKELTVDSWWLKLVIFVIFWMLRPSGRAIHIRLQSGAPFRSEQCLIQCQDCQRQSVQRLRDKWRRRPTDWRKSVAFTNKIRPSMSLITPQISSLTSRDPGNYGSPLPRQITSVECPSLKVAANFTSLSLLPGLKDGTQRRQELHLCPWCVGNCEPDMKRLKLKRTWTANWWPCIDEKITELRSRWETKDNWLGRSWWGVGESGVIPD